MVKYEGDLLLTCSTVYFNICTQNNVILNVTDYINFKSFIYVQYM